MGYYKFTAKTNDVITFLINFWSEQNTVRSLFNLPKNHLVIAKNLTVTKFYNNSSNSALIFSSIELPLRIVSITLNNFLINASAETQEIPTPSAKAPRALFNLFSGN